MTNETILSLLRAAISTRDADWRSVVRVAVGLGATADDCWAASDDAWDARDLRAARMLQRAAAWFSESPSERRLSRAFPVPESIGTDPIGTPANTDIHGDHIGPITSRRIDGADRVQIEGVIAAISTDTIKRNLADFHADEGEIGDWAEWARCWAIDSVNEGVPVSDVLAVLRGEA